MKTIINTLINLSLLALALVLLVSCDREQAVPGGLVSMKIDFRGMETGSSEDLRSASSTPVSSQRIVLPSGEEWQVDLSIDPESPLRAATLTSGAKIRLLAIHSGNLVRYVDWQQGSTVPALFIPDTYSTCDFICYSYNSTSTLPSSSSLSLPVEDDPNELLLWRASNVGISAGGSVGSVTLTRQLTHVKLKLDCSGDGKTITNVSTATPITLTPGVTGDTYNLAGGALVTTVSSSPLSFKWTTFNAPMVTSEPLPLIPQTGFTLTIPANAITMETGVTQNTATEIPFPTSQLAAGKTHTISVKLVKTSFTKFASSNIYWDATNKQLTFEPYSPDPQNCPTCANSDKNYQGVFFRFGSLIGISAVESWSVDATTGTTIYVPYYVNAITHKWVESKAGKTNDDVSGIPGATAHPAWTWPSGDTSPVPYISENDASSSRDATWVKDNFGAADWAEYKGDICQYISETQGMTNKYRLPTSNEFGLAASSGIPIDWVLNSDRWEKVDGYNGSSSSSWTTNNDDSDATGKRTTIRSGASYGSTGNFFPAAGYRYAGDGVLYDMGRECGYWTGSVGGNLITYCLVLSINGAGPANNYGRFSGYPVRCVLQ
jgi:hypothetical protein